MLHRAVLWLLPTAATRLFDVYRPEKHYMRGPGPKSLSAREGLRARTEDITRQSLPESWLALTHSLHERERLKQDQGHGRRPHDEG